MPKLLVNSLHILESLSQCISYPKSHLQALKWGTTWLFSNDPWFDGPLPGPTCRLLKIYSSKDSSNKNSLEIQIFTAWISGQFSGFPSWHFFLFPFGSVLVVFLHTVKTQVPAEAWKPEPVRMKLGFATNFVDVSHEGGFSWVSLPTRFWVL